MIIQPLTDDQKARIALLFVNDHPQPLTSETITMVQLREFAAQPDLGRTWETVARLALQGCRRSRAEVAYAIRTGIRS